MRPVRNQVLHQDGTTMKYTFDHIANAMAHCGLLACSGCSAHLLRDAWSLRPGQLPKGSMQSNSKHEYFAVLFHPIWVGFNQLHQPWAAKKPRCCSKHGRLKNPDVWALHPITNLRQNVFKELCLLGVLLLTWRGRSHVSSGYGLKNVMILIFVPPLKKHWINMVQGPWGVVSMRKFEQGFQEWASGSGSFGFFLLRRMVSTLPSIHR